jgi:hypothetical protein
MAAAHDKRTIDKAIKLYQQGLKITEIEERTGVLRASLYHALRTKRMAPSRTTRARDDRVVNSSDADTSIQYLLDRLNDTQQRLAAAEAALAAITKLAGEATARR